MSDKLTVNELIRRLRVYEAEAGVKARAIFLTREDHDRVIMDSAAMFAHLQFRNVNDKLTPSIMGVPYYVVDDSNLAETFIA